MFKKKIFGIIATLSLLLSLIIPPVNVIAEDEGNSEDSDYSTYTTLFQYKDSKLDSRLKQLVLSGVTEEFQMFAQQNDISLEQNLVQIVIECEQGYMDTVLENAVAIGVEFQTSYDNLLQVMAPVSSLTNLSLLPDVKIIRLPMKPLPAEITNEGVDLINANDWQNAGRTGSGVKVAVLDCGFTGYNNLIGTELPSNVITKSFYTLPGGTTSIEGNTDHGTACAEIIHDIAPDAQLYLVNFGTFAEFGNAVNWLTSQGIDVISCSVGWPVGGPGDGTGPVCDLVEHALAWGILWVQSAGNNAQRHWQGNFVDTDQDGVIEFSPGYETNYIYANYGDPISVALRWDDTWGASSNDFDLVLFDDTLTPVAGSIEEQNGNDDPTESFTFIAEYTGYYYITIITVDENPVAADFDLYTYYHNLEDYVASGSIIVPADAWSAMTVGAVPWNNPTSLEPFSSQGPTRATEYTVKPDLVAPDGVTTSTDSSFTGTSASAPCAAGAAVLVRGTYPSYNPLQTKWFLQDRAVFTGSGIIFNNQYGYGRLLLSTSADIAVRTVAASAINTDNAAVNGRLDSLGIHDRVYVSFEWGDSPGILNHATSTFSMQSPGSFSTTIEDLDSDTTYYFRPKVVGGGTTRYGQELSFTTKKIAPSVTTLSAGNITSRSATLNGNLMDKGDHDTVAVFFEWGPSEAELTNSTVAESVNQTGSYAVTVDEFEPNMTYYFRAKAYVDGQAAYGSILSFTTETELPLVSTVPVSDIGRDRAVLNGNLSCLGGYTSALVTFEWGTISGALGNETPVQQLNAPSDYFDTITGLSSNTVYFFRARAVNGDGTAYGDESSFTTLKELPDVTTSGATNITADSAVLTGIVNSLGDYESTDIIFEWGTISGSLDRFTPVQTFNAVDSFNAELTGLYVNTRYYYRVKASFDDTVLYTTESSFETPGLVSLEILPQNPIIPPGHTQQFIATGLCSDGSTTDLTHTVTWISYSESIASIDPGTGLATGLIEGETSISAICDNGFWTGKCDSRIMITIDHTRIDESLIHFPVLIYLSSTSGLTGQDVTGIFDELGSDCLKLAVTSEDGEQMLNVEIEKWDHLNREAWLWVSGPDWEISPNEDTVIYLYYDKSQPDNIEFVGFTGNRAAIKVWNSHFVLVNHMQEGQPSEVVPDSTAYANRGEKMGNGPVQVEGKIGDGQQYTGEQCITVADADSLAALQKLTVELIVSPDTGPYGMAYIAKLGPLYPSRSDDEWEFRCYPTTDYGLYFTLRDASTSGEIGKYSYTDIADGKYHHIAATWDGTATSEGIEVYNDGENEGAYEFSGGTFFELRDTGQPIRFGRQDPMVSRDFLGLQDEIRISNIDRSAGWMKATYHTCWDSLVIYQIEDPYENPLSVRASTSLTVDSLVKIHIGEKIVLSPGLQIPSSNTTGCGVTLIGTSGINGDGQHLTSFNMSLSWDPNIINVDAVSVSAGALACGWEIETVNLDNVIGTVEIIGSTEQNVPVDCALFYLGITAIGEIGETAPLTVTINNLYDSAGQPITCNPESTLVVVTDPGDINGDMAVNVIDITTVAMMILGFTDETPVGDVNQDNSVNVLDMTKIAMIILGLN